MSACLRFIICRHFQLIHISVRRWINIINEDFQTADTGGIRESCSSTFFITNYLADAENERRYLDKVINDRKRGCYYDIVFYRDRKQ